MNITNSESNCSSNFEGTGDAGRFANLQNKDYLPEGYDYRLCNYEPPEDNSENFKASFRIKLSTKESVETWFKALQEKSATTWKVHKTYPRKHGSSTRNKNLCRMDYGCHHNTRPSANQQLRKSSKHTSCRATIYLVVKRQVDKRGRRSRSTDPHITEGYITKCTINNTHNHAIRSAEALRRRDVSEETRDRLLKLYEDGHTPLTALEALKLRLQEEYGTEYAQKSADRSVCPDIQYCYRFYDSLYKADTPKKIKKSLLKALEAKLRPGDMNDNYMYFKMDITNEGHSVIVICSASMQRVHQFWPASKELCFLHTSEGLERQNWRVTVLLTHSPIGELPLGIIMSSSRSPATLFLGLQLLHKLLPKFSFYELGHSGPSVVITRDDKEEQLMLHEVYPTAELLVNPQDIIKAAKDWLSNPLNRIGKGDRLGLLKHLRVVIKARTPEDLDSRYDRARQDAKNRNYENYMQYLCALYERKTMWSVALKSSPALLNNRVSGLKVPMNKILQKVKGYNVLRLVDDLLTRLGPYYERKLLDAGNNPLKSRVTFASYPTDLLGPKTSVKKVSDRSYEVITQTSDDQIQTSYQVNTENGVCTCHSAAARIPCQHQMAVYKKFRMKSGTFFPAELRSLFIKIATGQERQGTEWLQPLITADGKQELLAEDSQIEETLIEFSAALERETTSQMINNGNSSAALEQQTALQMINNDNSSDDYQGDMEETEEYEPHETLQRLQVFEDLKKRLFDDPAVSEGPIRAFVKNYLEAKQERRLESALSSFGQNSSVSCKVRRMDGDVAPDTSHPHVIAESEEVHRRKVPVRQSLEVEHDVPFTPPNRLHTQ